MFIRIQKNKPGCSTFRDLLAAACGKLLGISFLT